ncbi:uncharacterized protein LOC109014023 [Juglans regia]|uniref:Uncharacterized protein LOC109014023 n=1 Tax=Juglans regia TaxID=51240 RepID=A0A2I4H6U8_JUGRE|nr:uncharacterized protein LOC109014023 [Juglans regia]
MARLLCREDDGMARVSIARDREGLLCARPRRDGEGLLCVRPRRSPLRTTVTVFFVSTIPGRDCLCHWQRVRRMSVVKIPFAQVGLLMAMLRGQLHDYLACASSF